MRLEASCTKKQNALGNLCICVCLISSVCIWQESRTLVVQFHHVLLGRISPRSFLVQPQGAVQPMPPPMEAQMRPKMPRVQPMGSRPAQQHNRPPGFPTDSKDRSHRAPGSCQDSRRCSSRSALSENHSCKYPSASDFHSLPSVKLWVVAAICMATLHLQRLLPLKTSPCRSWSETSLQRRLQQRSSEFGWKHHRVAPMRLPWEFLRRHRRSQPNCHAFPECLGLQEAASPSAGRRQEPPPR